MYDYKIEQTTSKAIKQNLDGIKKISKERILVELFKILDLKNFYFLNQSVNLREIFILIFPEFENLNRIERLIKICNNSKISRTLLLAVLLIDDKNTHEYFCHKYNVSNIVKDNLNLLAKNLKKIKENKGFFYEDIKKNIYLNGKDHLVNLNVLNFALNTKLKIRDFSEILKNILKSKTYKFNINGKYLMKHGMQQGAMMGKVLKTIEEEWLKNNFKITQDQIKKIIQQYSN